MKANAPEKIYVQLPSRNWIGRTWNETPIKEGDNPNWKNATNIEYTRTDAFIEKVINFLNYKLDDVVATRVPGTIIPHRVAKQELIEDLKNTWKDINV